MRTNNRHRVNGIVRSHGATAQEDREFWPVEGDGSMRSGRLGRSSWRWGSWRWAWVLLLVVSVATGCAPELSEPDFPENNTLVPPNTLFEPGDSFDTSQNAAIVILGVRADELLGNNSVAALWQQYDPTRGRLVGAGTRLLVRYSGGDQKRNVNRVLYYVFRTRPGYYILQQSTTTFRASSYSVLSAGDIIHPSSLVLVRRKNYGVEYYDRLYVPFGRGRAELNQDNLLNDLLSATVSHRFYVNPGDVVYLGNFVIGRTAPWIHRIERDDQSVLEVLQSYPNLNGQLVFRDSLVPMNIRCDFSSEDIGLERLRDMVLQNTLAQKSLENIGCSSGILPVKREDNNLIEVEPTIDYDLPLTTSNPR